MWIVMMPCSRGLKAHSAHEDEAKARAWAECLEHDSADECAVAELPYGVAEEIQTLLEKK